MRLLKPAPLRPGDTIAVVSPASPIAAYCPARLRRGVEALEALGFRVVLGAHASARHGHTAGTRAERVEDLHRAFADPEVQAIITTIGGFNSNQLLDALDYELIRRHPKILMGYSDISALLTGIQTRTGLVTFLGPAILPQFGEHGGLHPYTEAAFRATLMEPGAPQALSPSGLSIHEHLAWDREDTRPRRAEAHAGPSTLQPGRAEGPIVAGNMGTLLALVGTPYFPSLDGAILCVEEDESESSATIDRFFTQLRLMGAYSRISALVVGRMHPDVKFSADDSLEALVRDATAGHDLPIALGFDFGHTDPMFILPQGVRARADFGEHARFELLEAGVAL